MTAAGASQSVFDYLDRKPLQRPSGTLQPNEFKGDIEFNNVSLVYPARPNEIAVQVNFDFSFLCVCVFINQFLFE